MINIYFGQEANEAGSNIRSLCGNKRTHHFYHRPSGPNFNAFLHNHLH